MDNPFIIDASVLQLITSDQAYHYNIIPIDYINGILIIKTHNDSLDLKQELQIILNKTIEFKKETLKNIKQYLAVNYRVNSITASENIHYSNDFLEKLLITAKTIGSSDIHFEPYENKCRIRLRLDGKLKEYYIIDTTEYPIIVNKLKIKAGLDISEKRLSQDGRISLKTSNTEFDIRMSTLPTLFGEKIVLRILNKDTEKINLRDLGFTEKELETYTESIKKTNGIVLISGPTGSGKTTTLYATLKLLNEEHINILTIEDPIEYTLEGVNQVQLKETIGLDFSSTLRTFLRQDPDIIMVGEIRDIKTANMAIRAGLTGHLVLSTIHTNSAWATVSRLIDMGVPPFLIASTLNLSVAQRLVRKLCDICKEEQPVNKTLFPNDFKIPSNLKIHYKAVGCNNCFHTGYNGRKAIYEIIPITKTLVGYIKQNSLEIDDYLAEQNLTTLKKNAIHLIREGTTSIEEVYTLLYS